MLLSYTVVAICWNMRLRKFFITFLLILFLLHFFFQGKNILRFAWIKLIHYNLSCVSFMVSKGKVHYLPFSHHFLSRLKSELFLKTKHLKTSFPAQNTNTVWNWWDCFKFSIAEEFHCIQIHSENDPQRLEIRVY